MSQNTVSDESVTRKLDRNIIPIIIALYLFSFLDRVNIGNARLYGLEEDLGLSPRQWQVSVSILFVTYMVSDSHWIRLNVCEGLVTWVGHIYSGGINALEQLFEIPSNLAFKKLHPRRYIAGISIGWGIVATLTGLVQNYHGFVAARLALGLLEAGLVPGLVVSSRLHFG